jgi:hypothetical protein
MVGIHGNSRGLPGPEEIWREGWRHAAESDLEVRSVRRQLALALAAGASLLISACGGGGGRIGTAYVLTVNSSNPATGVEIGVTTAGNNSTTHGTTSFSRTYIAGSSFALSAPALVGANIFSSWSGCASATTVTCALTLNADTTVTANYLTPAMSTPAVTVTPSSSSITIRQPLPVTVAVAGLAGGVTPSGTVTLSGGGYSSAVTTLSRGSAQFNIPAGALSVGSDTLQAVYAPDTASSAVYGAAAGAAVVAVSVPAIITPTVTVTPSSSSVTTRQALSVSVAVAGSAGGDPPTGTVTLAGGGYSSTVTTLSGGSAQFNIPAGALSTGSDTLQAAFTPDTASAPVYGVASGAATVTVAVPAIITPTVTVTPSLLTISTAQAMTVAVAVSDSSGSGTPTGTVTLTGGSYRSGPVTLGGGNATIDLPAGSLAMGTDTLAASYAPDSASASIYSAAAGTSSAVTVVVATTITVDQSSLGPAVSSQLLGMNMAYWYDPSTPAIVPAFQQAGIRGVRWPGGSGANDYHWATNTLCSGAYTAPAAAFDIFVADVIQPANLDVALTANYSTDAACTGPGDPAEAAAWVQNALDNGNSVTHVTVGNENWGFWETDLHALSHDPTTYANATATGYYPQIKAVNPKVLVGVGVNPWNSPAWDPIVLSLAKYDFVEYHYYAGGPFAEDDTYLVQQAAQQVTTDVNAIKAELATAGKPDTPIFFGEIGSVYNNPGKQSTSITQALFAGQVLGEMMNDGVSRAAWWLAFGGCDSDPTANNFSSSLYGWQNFGGYMVFSDGLPETDCAGADIPTVPAGTLLPTARAFQLFSTVAVDGEHVLTAKVSGDTTDVRVYAATTNGGTGAALVIFNLNQTASEPVAIELSKQSESSSVTVETYSKAIYDQSKANVWADPTNLSLGAQTFPLALTLDPWSMNVVIVK